MSKLLAYRDARTRGGLGMGRFSRETRELHGLEYQCYFYGILSVQGEGVLTPCHLMSMTNLAQARQRVQAMSLIGAYGQPVLMVDVERKLRANGCKSTPTYSPNLWMPVPTVRA